MLRDAHRRRSVGLGALDIYYKQYMSSHLERSVSREELGVSIGVDWCLPRGFRHDGAAGAWNRLGIAINGYMHYMHYINLYVLVASGKGPTCLGYHFLHS
jgi:hypothetical protein